MNIVGFTDRAFFAPAFRIKLKGQDTGRDVIADVLEMSFTDDLENIDSFEFVLNDWDPVKIRPRYSSPWDENGNLLTLYENGPPVPVFEPGAEVSLFMGYTEDGDLPLIMKGEVISLAPSFPASGAPSCRVRALDAFQRNMQKIHVEKNYSGTAKSIVDQICSANDIPVQWSDVAEEGSEEKGVDIEGILYDEIQKRARGYGLSMVTARPCSCRHRQRTRARPLPNSSGAGHWLASPRSSPRKARWPRSWCGGVTRTPRTMAASR
jgi:hypothetical protein